MIGVHRSTVHRWLIEPEFIATLNLKRQEVQESADARLFHMVSAAIDTIQEAVERGDKAIALTILRGLGMLPGKRVEVGLTDPQRVARHQEASRAEQRLWDELGMM